MRFRAAKNYAYFFGGPHHQDCSVVGVYNGPPYSGKQPHDVELLGALINTLLRLCVARSRELYELNLNYAC